MSRILLNQRARHLCSATYRLAPNIGRTFSTIPTKPFVSLVAKHNVRSLLGPCRQYSTDPNTDSSPDQATENHVTEDQTTNDQITTDETTTSDSIPGSEQPAQESIPDTSQGPLSLQVDNDQIISISGGGLKYPVIVDRHWLRDSCECSICKDSHSGQKNFVTLDVPTALPIKKISKEEDDVVEVVWENDFLNSSDHVSRYSVEKLTQPANQYKPLDEIPNKTLWDSATFEKEQVTVDYDEWVAGGDGFFSGLRQLNRYGLLFLRNVPHSEESVVSIANQIGPLQETFYGRTWDVRSKPNAENIAYTSASLGLHADLLYTRESPHVQILHCLENTCEGGESLFSDGLRARSLIAKMTKKIYGLLSEFRVHYQYVNHGHNYNMIRAVLPKGPPNRVSNLVFWSPPFQSTIQRVIKSQKGSDYYRSWLKAASVFRQLLEEEPWVYQYKLQPGECVVFDNLRILHGRKQFDENSGNRWLKGTYITGDVYKSKLVTSADQMKALGEEETRTLMQQAELLREKHDVKIDDKV
ncbi:Clavaminate synthase-like protein [Hypoxylon fragiforme]|uniref:Clavaminate synthase-like protein n=1 Tax=Hypoxylon fragiforme TaxID=63214 RepID=UPI0020C6AC31|nr:Clavaminate synthase-like protein [Hypoxylon fragiforme]KAI2608179.1 Clavaminate synthase-like protein [Hypoxylon fragiforme]